MKEIIPTSLQEVSRRDLVMKSRLQSRPRFQKRLNYQVTNFRGVDLEQLFENDYFVFSTPIGNYICTIAFPGVFTELKNVVRSTGGDPTKITLQMVIRALRIAFDATDEVKVRCSCADFCLHPSTQIKLLEGKSLSVEELYKEFLSGRTDLWVYSIDNESHDFRPGHISDVWISGYTDKFIKVTLDNGEVILTTPDHRYMLRDGSYLEAKYLTKGQSLMADYNHSVISVEVIKLTNLVPVYDLTVDRYKNFLVSAGVVLHNCYRFMYWADRNGYLYGPPTPGTQAPPDIRNPNNSIGSTCKHLDLLLSNKQWLVKAASVVNAFIKAYPDKASMYLYDTYSAPIRDDEVEDEYEEDEVEVSSPETDRFEVEIDDDDENDDLIGDDLIGEEE